MYYKLLGVFAGLIAIGIWALMGLTIFHGKDLVMHRENWELARILIPSMISVAGWLVTIWWALRQVEITSEKNRSLQHEMLQLNEKNKVIDSVILVYLKIDEALNNISFTVNNLKNNIEYKNKGIINPDLHQLFRDSSDKYTYLCEQLSYLKIITARMTAYNIGIDDSLDFIDKVSLKFSSKSDWLTYQEAATSYLMNNESSPEVLYGAIQNIIDNCNNLSLNVFKVVMGLKEN